MVRVLRRGDDVNGLFPDQEATTTAAAAGVKVTKLDWAQPRKTFHRSQSAAGQLRLFYYIMAKQPSDYGAAAAVVVVVTAGPLHYPKRMLAALV